MRYPSSIQNLINFFSKLPTVGPKTAERYVFYLLQQSNEELQKFARSIAELKEKIIICSDCGAVSEKSPCEICSNQNRDKKIICVVANTRDMIAIESPRQFKGVYHILGGVINSIEEIGPEKLKVKELIKKIEKEKAVEVILALNPTVEGETTALYLINMLKPLNIKISRLARGLPTGADLEYADETTIANALKYRTSN